MKTRHTLLALSLAVALSGCGTGGDQELGNSTVPAPPKTPLPQFDDPTLAGEVTFTDAVVHDPSVVQDADGTFYVFGSHLAYAKTTDWMNWEQPAYDGVANSPLFDTYASELTDAIDWVGGHIGSWASDVIRLEDGRYYFYYNHCASPATGECDASRSYLGVAVSDNIEGPYTDLGLIVTSGHVGAENPGINGEDYNGNHHPNAIDPDVFFDKEGRLWMVYGSYSGGIFIMEMDPSTGMALPNQGYGTKLMGGFYSAIEGPYMLYSPDTDYYYLFTSFGGFAQQDGYNMRISRSRNPDGPFEDIIGQDMIGASGSWAGIEPYGTKIMGGMMFDHNVGEAGEDHGYMAPGHNSAYYDPETGKYLLIFHTRFPNLGEGHAVRVHEMFVTKDGWLAVSPHRYVPIEGENIVDGVDLQGTYQFINHEHDINREVKVSRYLTLEEDGVISGDFAGTYEYDDENNITLIIDQVGTFTGVMAWQYNDSSQRLTPTFTALSADGAAVWGSQLEKKTTSETLNGIASSIAVPATTQSDIALPTLGALGATITWSSDIPGLVSARGEVNRPNAGEPDQVVTLTATITLNGEIITQTYTVTIPARKPRNRIAHYDFEQSLGDALGFQVEGSVTGTTPDTTDGAIAYTDGQHGDALWLDGTSGVRLPDGLIDNYEYTVSMWLNPTVITGFTTAFFGAQATDNWLSLVPQSWDGNTMLWSGSQRWFDASTGMRIPEDSWTHVAFSVKQGAINVYVNGETRYTGGGFTDLFTGQNAVFTLGVNYWDIPYNGLVDDLKIYEGALSAAEIRNLDINPLESDALLASAAELLDLGDLSSIRDDIRMPTTGAYAAAISWASSHPDVVSTIGEVTRPAAGQPDADVTLTATITLDGLSTTKSFVANVRSLGLPEPHAAYRFDGDDLTDSTGHFAAGVTTAGLIGTEGADPVFADGTSGRALVLNGAAGVQLPNNLITDDTYSISLWLNPAALTQFTTAFFGYANADSWISFVPNGNDAVAGNTMVWSGTSWYDAGMGEQIPVDAWSHLAMTNNGGSITLYLNGAEVYTGTGFPNVFGPAAVTGFAIGVNYWDTPYNGMVDELLIFDEVITGNDVAQFYQQQMGQ